MNAPIVVIAGAIAFRVFADGRDRARITEYIQQQGGRVQSITWAPFGKGWFFEKNDRLYDVVYVDRDGAMIHASCKTGTFSGVYLAEERRSGAASRQDRGLGGRVRELEREKERLRNQIGRREG